MKEKPIIAPKRGITLIVIAVIIVIIVVIEKVYFLSGYEEKEALIIALWQGQLTLSVLTLSIAALIINNVSDRILGSSIKRILFKDEMWILNYPETMLSMFMLSGISTLALLTGSLYSIILLFFITMILVGWLSYLTYIISVKKSRIYSRIKRIFDKKEICIQNKVNRGNQISKTNRVCESLIVNCIKYRGDIIKDNRSYIVEEIILLDYLIDYCETRYKDTRKEVLENIVLGKVEQYIKGDDIDEVLKDELIKHLYKQIEERNVLLKHLNKIILNLKGSLAKI